MKIKIYTFIVLFWVLSLPAVAAEADSVSGKEQQIKAAFVYNFMKFIDWPQEKMKNGNEPIIIGIIGDKSAVKYFDPIKEKQIKDRNITVEYFEGFQKPKASQAKDDPQWDQKIESLKKCHIVLFCTGDSEEVSNPARIIEALKEASVLTVGETVGFLEAGGMFNFLIEDGKVCFEVNLNASDKAGFNISSNLLRLAKRVLKASDSAGDTKK